MNTPFGMPPFDPSKMDPKVLMEMSRLIQQLPPDKLNRMQSLMHNMMAGHDVRADLEEFEKGLPPGFREKLMGVMGPMGAPMGATPASQREPIVTTRADAGEMNMHEARLTILNAVADGRMNVEEAERLLFPSG